MRFNWIGVAAPVGPPRIWTFVEKLDGGEPKFRPLMLILVLHVPEAEVGDVITGTGTGVLLGVAVAVPGVLVGTGVSVGVGVAPSGAKVLKPDVMHGRRPSA